MLRIDEKKNGANQASAISLSDNSRAVLERRYLRRGADGKPVETVDEMFYRVASHVGQAEEESGGDVEAATGAFYDMLAELKAEAQRLTNPLKI